MRRGLLCQLLASVHLARFASSMSTVAAMDDQLFSLFSCVDFWLDFINFSVAAMDDEIFGVLGG
jgi:hypothetical protein